MTPVKISLYFAIALLYVILGINTLMEYTAK